MIRAIADNGLPLKIKTEWTDNDYWERIHPDSDDMKCINVAGWLVRINGKKYPRGHTDGDGNPDWTYRYTPGQGQTDGYQKRLKRCEVDGMVICNIMKLTKEKQL